jgi:hypothetical protein
MSREKQNVEAVDAIAGDRRVDRRYGIRLDVKWKLIRRRRVLDSGSGKTVDLSSGGLLFDPGQHLPVGLDVELSITWPVMLYNVAPLQLVVSGRIVRVDERNIAVRTVHHEFRTAGVQAEHRQLIAANIRTLALRTNSAIYASRNSLSSRVSYTR